MYMYPVKHRNHPVGCYIPPESEDGSEQHNLCLSHELTMRKFMVHYANPQKLWSIVRKAITAHKLMCDIDAASMIGDVEYLSKLVKINLHYEDSTVGFNSVSEARKWTAEGKT